MTTTPRSITHQVLELCKKLDSNQTPVFVPVKPVANSVVDECYYNVACHIQNHGGSIQYGWTIWENHNVIIEGNFHACWRNMVGELIDITPKEDGEKEILFLPDTKRVYDGTPIDNVREILTKDPDLIKGFKLQEEFNRLRIKYNVDGQLSGIPVHELKRIGFPVPAGNDAGMVDMTGRHPEIRKGGKIGRNDRCPCGSGMKFKKCCGK